MTLHPQIKNSRRHLIFAALVLVTACVVFLIWRASQPSYQGRSLHAWLSDFPLAMDAAGNIMVPFPPEQQRKIERAGQAIRMMGDDALPVLESELRAKDNRLDFQLWSIFNRWHKYLRYEYDYAPAYVRRCRAISAVAELGSNVSRFVPTLKRIAEDTAENYIVRQQARVALERNATTPKITGNGE